MNEQELISLQHRVIRAAEEHGCHASVEVADFIAGDPPGSLRLKIVVARRSRQGQLLSHESNVVLMTNEDAASVERMVRDAAGLMAAFVGDWPPL